MIATLAAGSRAARADALARAGQVLWRAGPDAIARSADGGVSWTRVARLEARDDESGATEDAEGEPEDDRVQVRQLAVVGDSLLVAGDGGLMRVAGAGPRRLWRQPCRALAVGRGGHWAALCGQRLLTSDDGGVSLQAQPAPPGARSVAWRGTELVASATDSLAATARAGLLRCTERGLADDRERFRLGQPCARVRAEGAEVVAWGDGAAWLSTDGGLGFVPLPDAAAYDVLDLVPDGAGGAFALTDVGVVRLRPAPEADPPSSWLSRLSPRLSLVVQARERPGAEQLVVLGLVTLPLDAPARPAAARVRSVERERAQEMRGRAVRLRSLAQHVARSARKIEDPKRRALRLLRAQQLAAEASAVIEAVP